MRARELRKLKRAGLAGDNSDRKVKQIDSKLFLLLAPSVSLRALSIRCPFQPSINNGNCEPRMIAPM
jgi:hypothetical protein